MTEREVTNKERGKARLAANSVRATVNSEALKCLTATDESVAASQ